MKPLGVGLEITPMVKLGEIVVNKVVKFRIIRDGKPEKNAKIFGSYDGYAEDEMSMPFYAKSDLKGEFKFKALRAGHWYLKSEIEIDSGNNDGEIKGDLTTLSFMVK